MSEENKVSRRVGRGIRNYDDVFDEEDGSMTTQATATIHRDGKSEQLNNIKNTLAEISTVFSRFSEMVSMQELMVRRIDEDSEMALANAEKAKKELVVHYQNVSSYRNMIFKIFLVLIIFATLYILFI